jgi:hypothetical protein
MANKTIDLARTGKRYAILFAGTGERWTLNDLENCYRMLVKHYGFDPRDISVFYFDGNLGTNDRQPTNFWPDETTRDPYQIKIDGAGTAANFNGACAALALAGKLKDDDLLFVHLNGHGAVDAQSAEACVLQFNGIAYKASEFCVDLALLPKHASLLITMQQCFSAGFIAPVVAEKNKGNIKAGRVSLHCASAGVSYPKPDKSFDCFTWGWVAAHREKDPFGQALVPPVVLDNSGFVEAREAYKYARKVKHPDDLPRQRNRPVAARAIRLA